MTSQEFEKESNTDEEMSSLVVKDQDNESSLLNLYFTRVLVEDNRRTDQ